MPRPELHIPRGAVMGESKDPMQQKKYDSRTARIVKLIGLRAPAGIVGNEALMVAQAVYSPDGTLRGLVDFLEDYADEIELNKVTGGCPECGSKGYKADIGTRASGETFKGCEFCTGNWMEGL